MQLVVEQIKLLLTHIISLTWFIKIYLNIFWECGMNEHKKVLLCERKRHTDRGVSSTLSFVLPGGYPRQVPPGWGTSLSWPNWGGYPRQAPPGWGTPHPDLTRGYPGWASPWLGYPHPDLARGYPGRCPLAWVPLPSWPVQGVLRAGTPLAEVLPLVLTWLGVSRAGAPLAGVPPKVWTDRHLGKQYLTVVLRKRSVKMLLTLRGREKTIKLYSLWYNFLKFTVRGHWNDWILCEEVHWFRYHHAHDTDIVSFDKEMITFHIGSFLEEHKLFGRIQGQITFFILLVCKCHVFQKIWVNHVLFQFFSQRT